MPYSVVRKFEKEVAAYAGSKYGVAVSSCTNAIFLCLKYIDDYGYEEICIPSRTYVGVACAIKNAGYKVCFEQRKWQGRYVLQPTVIVDSALRFHKNMYFPGFLFCLSFHARKHLPIGRGGMILTDNHTAVEWLKRARFDGRAEKDMKDDNFSVLGWNMYLTPEQAARGLHLLHFIKDDNPDIDDYDTYPDLSKYEVFK